MNPRSISISKYVNSYLPEGLELAECKPIGETTISSTNQ